MFNGIRRTWKQIKEYYRPTLIRKWTAVLTLQEARRCNNYRSVEFNEYTHNNYEVIVLDDGYQINKLKFGDRAMAIESFYLWQSQVLNKVVAKVA